MKVTTTDKITYDLTKLDDKVNDNCLHESCNLCHGTGKKVTDGSYCFHHISCPCHKCTVWC